jgi:hypothetical protein
MAYRDALQIEESDNCQVVLRDGHKLAGHMRKWERVLGEVGNFQWCLYTKGGKKTWTATGMFTMQGKESKFDIVDFIIGQKPGPM